MKPCNLKAGENVKFSLNYVGCVHNRSGYNQVINCSINFLAWEHILIKYFTGRLHGWRENDKSGVRARQLQCWHSNAALHSTWL